MRRKRGAFLHAIGVSRGGRNTKIHALTDARGRPLALLLTPGNVNDNIVAEELIGSIGPARELLADKAYDSDAIRAFLKRRKTKAVIPPYKMRKRQYRCDRKTYRLRNVIERTFCRLKDFRRIAMRFDRRIDTFFSAVCLAATVLWWI